MAGQHAHIPRPVHLKALMGRRPEIATRPDRVHRILCYTSSSKSYSWPSRKQSLRERELAYLGDDLPETVVRNWLSQPDVLVFPRPKLFPHYQKRRLVASWILMILEKTCHLCHVESVKGFKSTRQDITYHIRTHFLDKSHVITNITSHYSSLFHSRLKTHLFHRFHKTFYYNILHTTRLPLMISKTIAQLFLNSCFSSYILQFLYTCGGLRWFIEGLSSAR